MQNNPDKRISRREAGKAAMGIVAGVLVGAERADAQTEPKPAPASGDVRVALIEKSRGKPFTEEQRKAVLTNIQGSDDAWTKARIAFTVPDQTEPDFVFSPSPVPRKGVTR